MIRRMLIKMMRTGGVLLVKNKLNTEVWDADRGQTSLARNADIFWDTDSLTRMVGLVINRQSSIRNRES